MTRAAGTLPGVVATFGELWDRLDGLHGPVAATLPHAAALLGADLAAVELAAREVEPYQHADRSPRWSVGELVSARLGLADRDGKGHRRSRRTGDRFGEARRHSRRGAAATNQARAADRAAAAGELVEDLPAVEDLAAGDQ